MSSTTAEISREIQSCMDQIVARLRSAASEVRSDRVSVFEMTEVLKTAFANRNRFDAALSRAIGALDKATEQAPKEMEAEEDRRVERRCLHIRELFDGGFELEGRPTPVGATLASPSAVTSAGSLTRGEARLARLLRRVGEVRPDASRRKKRGHPRGGLSS